MDDRVEMILRDLSIEAGDTGGWEGQGYKSEMDGFRQNHSLTPGPWNNAKKPWECFFRMLAADRLLAIAEARRAYGLRAMPWA